MFELARYHAPSTIFLDEIDSILTSRGGSETGEHEASRRMKTELLIQMDGVRGTKLSEQVFVMAASNLPWDLDIAVLRRLEKRVLVGLPVAEAREAMIRKHLLGRADLNQVNFAEVASKTEGYSGADIELVCREAAMIPVRRLMQRLTLLDRADAIPDPPPKASGGGNGNGNSGRPAPRGGIAAHQVSAADVDALLKADPITNGDIIAALETTKPSSSGGSMEKYQVWQNDFGAA